MYKAFLLTVKLSDVQMEIPGLVCALLALALLCTLPSGISTAPRSF